MKHVAMYVLAGGAVGATVGLIADSSSPAVAILGFMVGAVITAFGVYISTRGTYES